MQQEALRVLVAELDDGEENEEKDDTPIGFKYSDTYNDIYRDAETFFVAEGEIAYKIAASYTYSQAIAERSAVQEGSKSLEELIPPEFREFAHVFSKEASE